MTPERYFNDDVISVAISYSGRSHQEEFLQMRKVLKDIRRIRTTYTIDVFVDWDLNAGSHFKDKIPTYFNNADVIICLVTKEFLKNDFINSIEKPIIQKKHRHKNSVVVPIIISRVDYPNSWLFGLEIVTLPYRLKPVVNFPNRYDAWARITDGLHKVFLSFQQNIVENRVKRKSKKQPFPIPSIPSITKVIISGTALTLLAIAIFPKDQNPELPNPPGPDPPIVVIPPDLPVDPPITTDSLDLPTEFEKETVVKKSKTEISEDLSELISIQDRSCINDPDFPRSLSSYSYYGKEQYYTYESCQGINRFGYKPCKKNKVWYIVNERLDKHTILNVDPKIHDAIYAIRPFSDDIAEVYFFDGQKKYMAFCISLNDGEIINRP